MALHLAHLLGLSLAGRAVEARRSHLVEEQFLRRATPVTSGPPAHPPVELEYRSVGCWIPTGFDQKIEDTEPTDAMAVSSCFIFCKAKHEELSEFLGLYFGITKGDECWCAATYHGEENTDACTTPCSGGGPGCGGPEASNIYYMYACNSTPIETLPDVIDMVKEVAPETTSSTEKAAAELASKLPHTAQHADFNGDGVLDAHEITHAFHARFWVVHEGHTCGQGDLARVGGRETMVASLTDCQMRCTLSRACGGFTYDTALSQCKFVGDFDSGSVESGGQYVCYARAPG